MHAVLLKTCWIFPTIFVVDIPAEHCVLIVRSQGQTPCLVAIREQRRQYTGFPRRLSLIKLWSAITRLLSDLHRGEGRTSIDQES